MGVIYFSRHKNRKIYQTIQSDIIVNFNFSSLCFSVVSKSSALSTAFIIRDKK